MTTLTQTQAQGFVDTWTPIWTMTVFFLCLLMLRWSRILKKQLKQFE